MKQVHYIAMTLFFVPPLLLLTALGVDPATPVLKLEDVPFESNGAQFSGEACLAMCLQSLGHETDADQVFVRSELDPAMGRGCNDDELLETAALFGCRAEQMRATFDSTERWKNVSNCWSQVKRNLARQLPTIVRCQTSMTTRSQPASESQYLLVVGFDQVKDEILVHRPELKTGSFVRVDRRLLLNQMAVETDGELSVFCMCLAGSQDAAETKPTSRFTDADYAKHINKLREKLPNNDFSIVIQKPFVVIGDEGNAKVRQRSKNTIKWAVDRLKQEYFKKDPNKIIDIWLFKDKPSYEKHTKQLFGYKPHTPYGFYSSTERSLVMNISTGGGTLVHEIVHPFIESNFPKCPSWFNEGLASLYEQCRDKNGRIWGSTNWRLRGLQLTIKDNRLPKFKTLFDTTTREFYDEDPGSNYGQARYLCYYLQEQGKLQEFYRTFTKNVGSDKTGYKSLQKTLGVSDVDSFQQKWEAYVLGLRFPE